MMTTKHLCLVVATFVLMSCASTTNTGSDKDGAADDAKSGDAQTSVAIDALAGPVVDASPGYDAAHDAGVVPDASLDLTSICAKGCEKSAMCTEPTVDCIEQCHGDLPTLGCTSEELSALMSCFDQTCEQLADCFLNIACLSNMANTCGDGLCSEDETCTTCPGDCDICPPQCGDGSCNGGENCGTCPDDCDVCAPQCGDGSCDANETCVSCSDDCGTCACEHDVCVTGTKLGMACSNCVKTVCQADEFCCEDNWDAQCVNEAKTLCPGQCPVVCGDNFCDDQENAASCAEDCPAVCGDGACTTGETCGSCSQDCGVCPCEHDICVIGGALVDECNDCVTQVCAADAFCCATSWDATCLAEVESLCGQDCPAVCAANHDQCVTGGPLDAECGRCQGSICAVDAYCCETAWDATCVEEVATVCGEGC